VDYLLSYQNGELTRINTGSIEDGQTLWIDYEIESGLFSDETITSAIIEASAQLDNRIDTPAEGDAVSVLAVAETYLAVSILTQIRALDILQSDSLSASNKSNISSSLLDISGRYRQSFEDLIRPYAKKGSWLSGPTR